MHQHARPRPDRSAVRGFDDRDRDDRTLLIDGLPDGPRRCHGPLGGLHEHVDDPVATEAPPPYDLVVGCEIEMHEPRPAFGHDVDGGLADVTLQAASADRPDRLAMFRHEEAGALPSVGGTLDVNDGGERHPVASRPTFLDGAKDVL